MRVGDDGAAAAEFEYDAIIILGGGVHADGTPKEWVNARTVLFSL
jgi:hypothetical protein